ncbi:MAG: UDP-4-amino-4,6-dideoxy-N-acetyl-beta-L-altrosamine transaminase [Bacteroidota bacterium]
MPDFLPIPYGRQQITEDDIAAVAEVLRSDYLTTGPRIAQFEEAFAEYIGCKYAVAVANGTAALHLCAMGLNVRQGQTVLVPTNTFVASANCIRYCGGSVELMDVDPETLLLDMEIVRQRLEAAPKGTYAGIVAVDFAGHPVDMKALRALADQHDCWILEDACHAPGAYYDTSGERLYSGDGSQADLAIFSFHPVKHIAAGEGGMITTNDKALYERLKILRTHGITRDRNLLQEDHGGWYYEMQELGFNYRLSDIHCALGISQMPRAAANLQRRRQLAARYDELLAALPLKRPQIVEGHAWHLYVIQTERRKELFDFLRERKIYPQIHYIPVHYQPSYQALGWKKGDFPLAENYYDHCITLPLYPDMTNEMQDYVVEVLREFYAM